MHSQKKGYHEYLFCGMILSHQKEPITNMSNIINEISQTICWAKKAGCKIPYTIWFDLYSKTEKSNYTLKIKAWLSLEVGMGKLIVKDIKELSVIIEIFYILMGCGLKKCIHLLKLYCQDLWI